MARTRILRPYHFIDKNPVIDVMRTAVQDEGLMKKLKVAADLASLSVTTLEGWFNGDVRDPRHSSIMALMISLGYKNEWKKDRKLNIEEELEFARAWLKKQRAKAEKERKTAPKKRKAKQPKARRKAA